MKNLFFVILFLILNSASLVSQSTTKPFFYCDNSQEGKSPYSPDKGKYKPESNLDGQFLRALFVFVQFDDDNEPSSYWDIDQLPDYVDDIVDQVSLPNGGYTDASLSNYFEVMSNANFDFIGDVYSELVHLTSASNYVNYSDANQDVIDAIDDDVDFRLYDNWKLVNGDFVFNAGEADHIVDMIYIIYRNAPYISFGLSGGIANLGGSWVKTTDDRVDIVAGPTSSTGSGVTINRGYKMSLYDMVILSAHEYGHYLFGYGHLDVSGLMTGNFSYYNGTYAMNGWERGKLGYISYLTPASEGDTLTLGDFVQDDYCLKIPYPFNNPGSMMYLLVENHQRLSRYDQIVRGGELGGQYNWDTQIGKGIYVWLIQYGTTYPPFITAKPADGSWDFQITGTIYNSELNGCDMPFFERLSVNRNLGETDWTVHANWNTCGNFGPQTMWYDIDPSTKEVYLSYDIMGEKDNAYNFGYNEILTPWSNPSSYGSVIHSTHLSLQLCSQEGDNIKIRVFGNDNSAMTYLPPSKPQNLKVTTAEYGYITNLIWAPNIEPDVIDNGKYKICRAESFSEPSTYDLIATIDAYDGTTPITTWTDTEPGPTVSAKKIFYKISAVDNSNKESLKSDYDWRSGRIPKINGGNYSISEYSLEQNFPNPFNPNTKIFYSTKNAGNVVIRVFNMLGQEIAKLVDESKEPGNYYVDFDASTISSGIYLYTLEINNLKFCKKMIVAK